MSICNQKVIALKFARILIRDRCTHPASKNIKKRQLKLKVNAVSHRIDYKAQEIRLYYWKATPQNKNWNSKFSTKKNLTII